MLKQKILKIIGGLVLILGLVVIETWRTWPDENLHLIVCDVGQGDGLLVIDGFTQMVIDTGASEEKISQCLAQYLPFWDRQIEYLMITHSDNDHSGARQYLKDSFLIGQEIDQDFVLKNPDFAAFGAPAQSKDIVITPRITTEILWPSPQSLDLGLITENQLSVTALLSLGEIKILLTGDIDQEVEQALLGAGLITDIDILKIAHHGSKTSSQLSFLKEAEPEKCLISVGQNNSYGHPHPQILSNLGAVGCEVLRTDLQGSIEIVSDGSSYWLADK